jgi:hypothetical protein
MKESMSHRGYVAECGTETVAWQVLVQQSQPNNYLSIFIVTHVRSKQLRKHIVGDFFFYGRVYRHLVESRD